jgi:hypothetical protein
MGTFDFGSANTNPRNSGNGYANMLLGVITQYSEQSHRIAWLIGHSEWDAYAQDSWRVNPRFTLDYGLRVTHFPPWYERNEMTAAFYPERYDPSKAARIYRPVCRNGAAGNVACSNANQAAIDPAKPGVFLPFQLAGTVVPGSGDITNGIIPNGPGNDGVYYQYNKLFWGPRVGMAWDVTGDHKQAVRAAFGMFYDFPRGGNSRFIGIPPVSFNQVVQNITMDELASFSSGGSLTFTQNLTNAPKASLEKDRHTLPTSYQFNAAYQRDIGFSTTAEVAYVGNFTRNSLRTYNLDELPLYVFADPNNQFNQAALSQNYLFTKFPGMGNITDFTEDQETLRYHSLQISVQRRYNRGLQMGLAYTLSKGMGMQGWDPYTANPDLTINMGGRSVRGGEDALRERYWGPTNVDRRHNLVLNYSYLVPTIMEGNRILSAVLRDWQIAGVTKVLSGTAVNPSCSNGSTRGVAYSLPSYTNGVAARCNLTGEPINAGQRVDVDPANPDLLTAKYFNLAAFAMATPQSATVGDFGNAPLGLLRNPTVVNWDVTLERRFPIGNHRGLRLMIQGYNIFNTIQWTTMNANLTFTGANNVQSSTTAGQYGGVINPRQFALSVRFDW